MQLKQIRDMSFIEELFKTKAIMKLMKEKLDTGAADIDVVEYSLATKVLEHKLSILNSTNTSTQSDDNTITLNIEGSGKKVVVNLEKLREAITITEGHVAEGQNGGNGPAAKV